MTTQSSNAKTGQVASRGENTRVALLDAATAAFANHGFAAASLREIAQTAQVNQALVGYHFGNKEGLYLAVFDHIVTQMQGELGSLTQRLNHELNGSVKKKRLLEGLFEVTDVMLHVMSSEKSAHWVQLIVREQVSPTKAFDIIFNGFQKGLFELLTALILRLSPGSDPNAARMIVIGILGQALAYRTARASVLRHMQWDHIGPDELAQAQAHMRKHLTALLAK